MVHEEHWRNLLHAENFSFNHRKSISHWNHTNTAGVFSRVNFVLLQRLSGDMSKYFKLQKHDKGQDDNMQKSHIHGKRLSSQNGTREFGNRRGPRVIDEKNEEVGIH